MRDDISFSARRPSKQKKDASDNLAALQHAGEAVEKLSVDLPASLKRRLKVGCANEGLTITQVVCELIAERFPDSSTK